MSNYLSIKRIYVIEPRAENIPMVLSTISQMMEDPNIGIEWGGIYNNNWGDSYPYAPKAKFWAAHNDKSLLLKFQVEEDCVKAEVDADNREVSDDSCVQFFVSFDDTGYYAFEFSCIGKKKLTFRQNKMEGVFAQRNILDRIYCVPSLGTNCFAERVGDSKWELIVAIPMEVFFAHNFMTLEGLYVKANAYKCGDGLSKPHYLSWNPVNAETPDFHKPEFFGRMRFL